MGYVDMRLNSIHYFRGIAILFIVAGHCTSLSEGHIDTLFEKFIVNLTHGGSTFFIFISGFLFHHIFYRNFDYRNFMIKKTKNVLFPYIILSIIPIFYYVFINKSGPYPDFFFSSNKGIFFEYVRPVSFYFLTGGTFYPYWYIPFIMVIFALSPIFISFIHLTTYSKILIMSVMLLFSTIIHRPIGNLFVIQSVVYYTPVYLFGIVASIYKEKIYKYLERKEIYLLLIAFLFALSQVAFYKNFLNLHKNPFDITVIDIMILQKCILCLFFMVWLHRFEDRQFTYLNKVAEASFAIYFLHPIILCILAKLLDHLVFSYYEISVLLILIPSIVLVLLICLMVALITKFVFNSKSRLVIGW